MDLPTRRAQQQSAYDCVVSARKTEEKTDNLAGLRLKCMRLIYSRLLDYKHNSPTNLLKCLELLIRLSENVAQHPDDAKFRKVVLTSLRLWY
jgi:hypothetical protein